MKQFYYTIQTLLRGQGNNMIKIVSLTLGLFVGILLFSRVAFELNYDSYYQEPESTLTPKVEKIWLREVASIASFFSWPSW